MEKLIYLCGRPQELSEASFRDRLIERLVPLAERCGALKLSLNIADLSALYPGDRLRSIPRSDAHGLLSASVSFWLDSLDRRADMEAGIASLTSRYAAYSVTESVPVDYASVDWAPGERSPGLTIVAAFCQPDWVTESEFFARWHGSHTPLSLEVHPLSRYLRHTVSRVLTPGSPPYRAIVEERVACEDDLIDEERFYSSQEGKQRVEADLATFVDMASLQANVMSEYLFWRPGADHAI